jgi:uncharacterized protein YcbX
VDLAASRVLRTIENPALVRVVARREAGRLSVRLPGRSADDCLEGPVEPTGEQHQVDYWGRRAEVEVVDGPWAAAFSAYVGREVALARPVGAGEVVYGAPVTVLTTGSLRLLAERLGRPVDPARFRATVVVEAEEPHVEDRWEGRELRLGAASVRVRGPVPRCAVVDLDPESGIRDTPALATLAGYRRGEREVCFGVDAVVVDAGIVRAGDPVELGRG